jgi:hypothetical protein
VRLGLDRAGHFNLRPYRVIAERILAEPASPAGLFPETVGQSTAIPAQFRGLARMYFCAIEQTDDTVRVLVRETLAPFRLRAMRGYRVLRPAMLVDAARRWRAGSPEFGLFGQTVELTKQGLEISEIRLTGAEQKFTHWRDPTATEEALVIAGLRVGVVAGTGRALPEFTTEVASRATLSFHCVGRWFQRSRDTTPDMLHDSLIDILHALPTLAPETEISIPTEGGNWRGLW